MHATKKADLGLTAGSCWSQNQPPPLSQELSPTLVTGLLNSTLSARCADVPEGYRMAYAPPLRHADQLFNFPEGSGRAAASAASGNLLGDVLTRRSRHGVALASPSSAKVCWPAHRIERLA